MTFDEFSSLSVPLPVRNTKTIGVTVQLLPLGSVPVRLELDVEIAMPMNQLQKVLVDELVERGLLDLTGNAVSASADGAADAGSDEEDTLMDVVGPNGTANGTPPSDDGYDIVSRSEVQVAASSTQLATAAELNGKVLQTTTGDRADGAVDGEDASSTTMEADYQLVDATTTNSSSTASPPTEGGGGGPASSPSPLYFHFGSVFSYKPTSVSKNYNTAESGTLPVKSFLGSMRTDGLIAFQLEHLAPEFRAQTYSYSASKTIYDDEKDEACKHIAVDLCMGIKVNLGSEVFPFIFIFTPPPPSLSPISPP